MQKKIGLVIVNYNDYKLTKRLLDNVKKYNCLEHIVVVDNNSTDDSFERLKKLESKKITTIKNSNRHFSSGLNLGAKYLIKQIGKCNIMCSNSDIIIKSEEDLKLLSSDIKEDIVVVGPVIEEQGNLNRGWKLPNTNTEILLNLPLISRYFRNKLLHYENEHYKNEISYVDVVSGCFFAIDSEFLKKINFLDENTFLYYEEQILSKKVKDCGKRQVVDNRVRIVHDHSVSVDKSIKRVKKYQILKTSQKYYVENYLNSNLIQRVLLYLTNKLSLGILYIRCLFR